MIKKIEMKGDWNIAKGMLKQKFAALNNNNDQYIEGKHDELIGRIQKCTGKTRGTIEKAFKEL